MIRRPRSPCLRSWLYKKRFHSIQMLLGPAHPTRPGSAHARARTRLLSASACISLPKGFLCPQDLFCPPQPCLLLPSGTVMLRLLSPVAPRGKRPDDALGLASPGSLLWSWNCSPPHLPPPNKLHARKSSARFCLWGPRIEHLGL